MNRLCTDLEIFAKEFSYAPAIIDDNSVYSFFLLKQLVDKATQYFIHEGIHSNKRIGLKFSSSAFHLISSLALLRIGASQLSFDNNDKLEHIQKHSADCKIDLLVTDNTLSNFNTKQLIVDSSILFNFQSTNDFTIAPFNSEKTALLNVGSGTTGEPKIISLSFSQLNSIIYERKDLLGVKQGDRFLSLAPYHFHVGKLRTLFALSRGLTNIFIDNVSALLPIMIDRLAVNYLYANDAHANLLLQLLDRQENVLNSSNSPRFPLLRAFIMSGSPVSEERINIIKTRLSPKLYLIYATNETSVATMATPELLDSKPNSVGLPIPECRVEIVNASKQLLPAGEIGQIRIQAMGMSQQYENNLEANQTSFVDGWFYPKDLGRLDMEGILYFEGRSDDLIFFDGANVFPREIESVLNQLPNVEDSAAFPIMQNGKIIPAVCIQLKAESNLTNDLNNNKKTIQYFSDCLEKEMGWKRPREIRIIDKLPRNKRGKIEKFKLRELIEFKE